MLKNDLQAYIDVVDGGNEICVVVCFIATGEEIVASYDVVADIGEDGGLIINVAV